MLDKVFVGANEVFICAMVENTLKKLGVSTSPISYEYLIDIFECIFTEDKYNVNLQSIYLQVAYDRGKNWKTVKRSVQRAIDAAWNRNKNTSFWLYLFGNTNTPVNDTTFITTIYRHIKCQ